MADDINDGDSIPADPAPILRYSPLNQIDGTEGNLTRLAGNNYSPMFGGTQDQMTTEIVQGTGEIEIEAVDIYSPLTMSLSNAATAHTITYLYTWSTVITKQPGPGINPNVRYGGNFPGSNPIVSEVVTKTGKIASTPFSLAVKEPVGYPSAGHSTAIQNKTTKGLWFYQDMTNCMFTVETFQTGPNAYSSRVVNIKPITITNSSGETSGPLTFQPFSINPPLTTVSLVTPGTVRLAGLLTWKWNFDIYVGSTLLFLSIAISSK